MKSTSSHGGAGRSAKGRQKNFSRHFLKKLKKVVDAEKQNT
jgi:hypothetical protein